MLLHKGLVKGPTGLYRRNAGRERSRRTCENGLATLLLLMAIQQCAYAFLSSTLDSDSSGVSLLGLSQSRKSCRRVQSSEPSSCEEKDTKGTPRQPFVTRSSATGQVTISVSLIVKNPVCPPKKKKGLLLPPIQNNHAKSKRFPKRKKVTFKPKKPTISVLPQLIQTELSGKRVLTVHFFPQDTIEVVLERNQEGNRAAVGEITYASLKHATAMSLRIELSSLNFFGIFLGLLGNPKELCIDDAVIPETVTEVCFQRLILVSEEEERFYLSKDDRALSLIFWELKDQYDRSQLFPLPNREKSMEMERLLSSPNYTIGVKRKFVELLLGFPSFYWDYYHKANYCTLQNSIWPNDCSTWKGSVVHVVPGKEQLTFLDVSREVEIESLPWHRVRSLTLKSTPVTCIDFEIVLVIKGQCISHFISVVTDSSKWLYSISIFMLRIIQSRDITNQILPPLDPYIAEYIEIQSEDENSHKNIILCSGEVAAIAFNRIDLSDNTADKKFRNRYCFRGPVYFKSKSKLSYWQPYSDSSDESDENSSTDDQCDSTEEDLNSLSQSEIKSTGNVEAYVSNKHPSAAGKESTKAPENGIHYEDASNEDCDDDYDNSADDELTDEESESQSKRKLLLKLEDGDDDVFYSNSDEEPRMAANVAFPWTSSI